MSLNLEFFNRPTNITAKVVCDSVSEQGIRLTTFEIEYPRIVMSEFNTHRAVSKNSSSSRAIPVSKMLEHTKKVNLKPVYFGSKKSGMQAGEELQGESLSFAQCVWGSALDSAVDFANMLDDCGVAKEVTNRLVEPFQLVKVVCTSTDWDNFFNLRLHPDADPNICMLAYKMYQAMKESKPILLKSGEWHLPYIKFDRDNEGNAMYLPFEEDRVVGWVEYSLEQALKYSTSRCASVSYRTEEMTFEKAEEIFSRLLEADVLHSSPAEHQATPIVEKFEYFDKDDLDTGYEVNLPLHPDSWEDGITHVNKQGQLCSGNLRGWVQYRHTLPNNTTWNFDFNERMGLFK